MSVPLYFYRFGLLPFRSPLLWISIFSFFSSGYLDVSVHRVPPTILFYSYSSAYLFGMRVAPFGYLRFIGCLLLPVAFRSLPRPSSAVSAKASALRPFCMTSLPDNIAFLSVLLLLDSYPSLIEFSFHLINFLMSFLDIKFSRFIILT